MTDSVEEVSLLPCPFCGSELTTVRDYDGDSLYAHPDSDNCVLSGTSWDADEFDVIAWNLRSIANTPGERVRVKPLEWVAIEAARSDEDPSTEETGDYEAATPFGVYSIEVGFGSDDYTWSLSFYGLPVEGVRGADDPDKLKAAAQADYEQRILSALTSPQADHFADAGNMVETPQAGAGEADFYALHSPTRMHIGLWRKKVDAEQVAKEYEGCTITPLYLRAPQHNDVREATHRHKKRGTEYVLIGIGKMQTEGWGTFTSDQMADAVSRGEQYVPVDMREVAIYRSATDPNEIWVRPREEFEDGRFEALSAALKKAGA